ncbi:MAG: response regulator, partial [Burkholderiaceae bacterium]|nr:response regulator [Burkholderiaceae bacterium]
MEKREWGGVVLTRTRVIFAIVCTVAAVTLSSALVGMYTTRNFILETLRNDTAFSRDVAEEMVSRSITWAQAAARRVANDIRQNAGSADQSARERWLEKLLREENEFLSLTILTPRGVLAKYGKTAPRDGYASSECARSAFGGEPYISSSEQTSGGALVFRVCTPVKSGQILVADLPGTFFNDIVSHFRIQESGNIFIIDERSTVLANMRPTWVESRLNLFDRAKTDSDFGNIAKFFSTIASKKAERIGVGEYTLFNETRICAYRPIKQTGSRWILGVSALPSEGPLVFLGYVTLGTLAVSLAISFVLAYFVSEYLMNPVRALVRKQEQLDTVARISKLAYWEWNCVDDTLHFSSHFRDEYGYASREVRTVGYVPHITPQDTLAWFDIVHPQDLQRARQDIVEYLQGKTKHYQSELRLRHKNGEYLWVLTVGHVVERRAGAPYLLFGGLLNVNDIRRTEEVSQNKSNLLATISHEIRTPLNAIIGLSEIRLQDQSLQEDVRADIGRIYDSSAMLLAIVNDVLDISKIGAGGLQLVPDTYDVARLINDTVQINIVRIASKPLNFTLDMDDTLPSRLYGDVLRVKQVMNNLLSNAFKYTNQGGVRLDIRYEREEDDVWLCIAVHDTGVGIKKKDIGNLFAAYWQLDMEATRAIEGTGLGLFITKQLVEMMDGEISVESEPGKGSTFTVRLRQKLVEVHPMAPELIRRLKSFQFMEDGARGKNIVRAYMPYGTVLVVDDVEVNLEVAKGLMAPYGLTVDCATSGPEAVEKIRSEAPRYDAVFMDHMMPHVDGVEATRLIRGIGTEYAKTVPIIALTANVVSGTREIFIDSGMDDFIAKPIDLMRLDGVLNKWIRDKQSPETLVKAREENARRAAAQTTARTPHLPDGKRQVEGVDFNMGIRHYGDENAYLQVLRSYMRHTPKLLEKLGDIANGISPDYVVTVHGLKGSSYGICAHVAGEMAERLETAAKANDLA